MKNQLNHFLSCLLAVAFANFSYGQEIAYNPYEKFEEKTEILTLSKGKYEEFFGMDSIEIIGDAILDTKTMKVIGFVEEDTSEFFVTTEMAERFMAVDPLARDYPHNSPYAFSENSTISFIELEGLEKISYAAKGNGANYSPKDEKSFLRRAKKFEKKGFSTYQISTGKEFIDALISETKKAGEVSTIIHFSHGTDFGLSMNWDEGLFKNSSKYDGENARSIEDINSKVKSGEIKFSLAAVWYMASCTACGNGGTTDDFSYQVTSILGIITISATGIVEPEIIDGKETGNLTTTGTFYKFEKDFFVQDKNGTRVSGTFESIEIANKRMKEMSQSGFSIGSKVTKTDLGSELNLENL